MSEISSVRIIDPDYYERKNLSTQQIDRTAIARSKAKRQAEKLKDARPDLRIQAITGRVEAMPAGRLSGTIILAAVDNLRARQWINDVAWRLNLLWVDAGVRAEGSLARVQTFVPGEDRPCLECGWDGRHYQNLEQELPCGGGARPRSTGAPAALGALAASFQAIECRRLLLDGPGEGDAGRQLMVETRRPRLWVTGLRRNRACRRADHSVWRPAELPLHQGHRPLGAMLARAGLDLGRDHVDLSVYGATWSTLRICSSCGADRRRGWWSRGGGDLPVGRCPRCSGLEYAAGFEALDRVRLHPRAGDSHLQALLGAGIAAGDLLTFHSARREPIHLILSR